MYDSLNKGFSRLLSNVPASEVALMSWINSDDKLESGSIKTALYAHLETGYEVITGLPTLMMETGVIAWISTYRPMAQENLRRGLHDGRTFRFVMQEGTFWTPRLWYLSGGLDVSLLLAGDWDLWRRFAAHVDFLGLNVVLGYHRRHPGQLSHDLAKYWAEVDRVVTAANLVDARPDSEAVAYKGVINISTNRLVIQKQLAGSHIAQEKEKAAKA